MRADGFPFKGLFERLTIQIFLRTLVGILFTSLEILGMAGGQPLFLVTARRLEANRSKLIGRRHMYIDIYIYTYTERERLVLQWEASVSLASGGRAYSRPVGGEISVLSLQDHFKSLETKVLSLREHTRLFENAILPKTSYCR